ncbi:hypothetical protein Chor_010500 [Crotalus horridus]
MLDNNPKFLLNQDKDCARRNSPVYISRVVSAMPHDLEWQRGHPSEVAEVRMPTGSVRAVLGLCRGGLHREGDLDLKYDVKFVFAEVNAEVAFLMLQSDLSRKKTMHPTIVGKKISTKSVEGEELPSGYPPKRTFFSVLCPSFSCRLRGGESQLRQGKTREDPDPTGGRLGPQDQGFRGDEQRMKNDVFFSIAGKGSEGPQGELRSSSPELFLDLEKTVPLRIPYEKYGSCLTPDNMIKVTAVLQQYENQKILLAVRDFHVKNPDIKIRVRRFGGKGREGPLDKEKERGARGLGETPVEPGEEAKVMMDFVPQQFGLRKLVVDFESDQLKGVKGYRNVIIAPLRK